MFRAAARASQPGQRYSVVLYDTANARIGAPLPLTNYGSDPVVGATGKSVCGIIIQDESNKARPGLFVDDLSFK